MQTRVKRSMRCGGRKENVALQYTRFTLKEVIFSFFLDLHLWNIEDGSVRSKNPLAAWVIREVQENPWTVAQRNKILMSLSLWTFEERRHALVAQISIVHFFCGMLAAPIKTYTYITTDYGVARGCDYVPRMPATNSFHFARRVAAFAGVASYMDRTVERETTNNQPMQDSGLPNLALKFRINNSKRPLNLDRILIHL